MGMRHHNGIEALASQLMEVGQSVTRFKPDTAINQDRGIGDLQERARSANGTGAAEKTQLNIWGCGHGCFPMMLL
jgi:hypothetical protein